MAKSRATKANALQAERGFSPPTATPRVLRLQPLVWPNALADGRQWHPAGASRPLPATRAVASQVVAKRPAIRGARARGRAPRSHQLFFRSPPEVLLCKRRKERREVLFAKKRTGKGSRSDRRFNQLSKIGCR